MKSYRFTLDYVVFSPRITIFDPYYIKELLSSQYTLKETTRKLQFAIWEELMPEGLIMAKPSNWKRIHRVALRAFGSRHLRSYFPIVMKSANTCIQKLKCKTISTLEFVKNTEVCNSTIGREVHVFPLVRDFTMDVIIKVTLGERFLAKSDKRILRNLIDSLSEKYFQPKFCSKWYLHSMFPEAVQTRAEIKTLLNICHKIIRKTRDNNDTGHGHGSFLRSLCSEHNKKFDLTDREIVHSLCAFFFAGVNTTAHAVMHTLIMLASHPKIQGKVRIELEGVTDANMHKKIHTDLPYLNAVIKETLRLYPPVGGIVPRVTTRRTTIGPVSVPKNTHLVVQHWVMARMPEFWGTDAEVFNPDRFLKMENSISVPEDMSQKFLTFGGGVRTCIGKHLSAMETSTILVHLLQNFRFKRRNNCEQTARHWQVRQIHFILNINLHTFNTC
mmetsp:Transcript_27265/g.43868  ORF Transcript_27265/g.43868 Transcript_27265/m.43868 type:complete len:443 (-) Transcript_27265:454-1782(-)